MEYRRLGTTGLMVSELCLGTMTLSALTDLVRQGKVRYVGVSNFTGWQLMKALYVSELRGFERVVSLQPQYSLVERNLEREVLPACGSRASASSRGDRSAPRAGS